MFILIISSPRNYINLPRLIQSYQPFLGPFRKKSESCIPQEILRLVDNVLLSSTLAIPLTTSLPLKRCLGKGPRNKDLGYLC